MTVTAFGPVLSTVNNTVEAATLADGRIIVGIQSNAVNVYSSTGALLGSVDPHQNGAGVAFISGGGHLAGLPDGGFVVTGARGSDIAFRVYNADLTERTSGAVTIATPGFFNGGTNYGHAIKVMPNGTFVIAWNTNQDALPGSSPIGTIGGNPIFQAGSGPIGTSIDIRASIYNASGALTSAPGFIVTQGDIPFPTYTIYSRFGNQSLYDIDALPDEPGQPTGRFITTYIGDRWGTPSGNPALTSPVPYDLFRINGGATGTAILGETPFNATTAIGQERTNAALGPHQTVVLASGLIAGIYTIDTGGSGDSRYVSKLQLFNTNGTPNGIEIDLALAFSNNHSAAAPPQIQAIATPSGGFLLAYVAPATQATSNDPSTHNVYVREYASNGAIINTTQLTTATGWESLLNLTEGPDGTFLVTSRINFSGNASTQLITVTGAGDFSANGLSMAETLNATGTNRNWIWSGGGADTINGGSGTNYLYGDAGNSTFNGGSGVNVVRGGTGNENMRGGGLADLLDGGNGNDTLEGRAGADRLNGGAGSDQASFFGSASRVIVNLFSGQGFEGDATGDTYSGIENVFASAFNDIVVGTALANLVDGVDGADTLYGNAGNDTLLGGTGDDLMFGEGDNDLLFGWLGADVLWGGDGNDVLFGEQDNDTLLGEVGNDVLLGIDGNDVMYGWIGNDTLYGFTGEDVLWGEQGNDLMLGEDGNDTFIGGLGRDTMTGGAGVDQFFNAFSEMTAGEVDLITSFDGADRYFFQTGAQIQYFNFNAPGYGTGAGIHVQVAGGVFILDVFGASAAQLQAQTLFF